MIKGFIILLLLCSFEIATVYTALKLSKTPIVVEPYENWFYDR
ncbi:hypothetical protein ACFFGV_17925 [Pontibacillus salicampi]|uniref:Cyclic lactone autoinducer peptide n=1 Tax=Pontibacillus salicampi TaxID=1449801 RepID=A0ABV6LST3_9BACI